MAPAPHINAHPTATTVLTVDLGALQSNYRKIARSANPAECAAVAKADAYGLGLEQCVEALSGAGCVTFFVATFSESERVRATLPGTTVYVLDGFFPDSGPFFAEQSLRPVLSSLEEVEEWAAFCAGQGEKLPAALHADTGMNRLGMPHGEMEALAGKPDLLAAFEPVLLISHLARADEPDNPMNGSQRAAFDAVRTLLPPMPVSLANSGGVFLGADYHYDMVSPGIALYGARSSANQPDLEPVISLHARIAQIRQAEAGETVGYGAAQTLARPSRIATIALGYADGIFRCLGARDGHAGLTGYIGDHAAPALGRVSMDLVTLDVTDVPEQLARRGEWVEIVGRHVSVDDLARLAGTIGYEILTGIGRRAERRYLEPAK